MARFIRNLSKLSFLAIKILISDFTEPGNDCTRSKEPNLRLKSSRLRRNSIELVGKRTGIWTDLNSICHSCLIFTWQLQRLMRWYFRYHHSKVFGVNNLYFRNFIFADFSFEEDGLWVVAHKTPHAFFLLSLVLQIIINTQMAYYDRTESRPTSTQDIMNFVRWQVWWTLVFGPFTA